MVYFPTGSSIRVRNDGELKRLGFDQVADDVDMETGDVVPKTPVVSLRKQSERKVGVSHGEQPRKEMKAS